VRLTLLSKSKIFSKIKNNYVPAKRKRSALQYYSFALHPSTCGNHYVQKRFSHIEKFNEVSCSTIFHFHKQRIFFWKQSSLNWFKTNILGLSAKHNCNTYQHQNPNRKNEYTKLGTEQKNA